MTQRYPLTEQALRLLPPLWASLLRSRDVGRVGDAERAKLTRLAEEKLEELFAEEQYVGVC